MTALNFFRHGLIVLALLVASCGSDSGASTTPPLDLTATAARFDLGSVDAEYFEAISYGPYDENLFDIYLPPSKEPTPLLIYIHGGGFTGGSRDTSGHQERVLSYLVEGVAYASCDYRLLQSPDPDGVLKPMQDSTRCLQFIRHHAEQFNIDPSNVVLMGGSAGAGTALWIGFSDEMAESASSELPISTKPNPRGRPVSRSVINLTSETSRPSCAKSWRTASSSALKGKLPT